MERHPLFVALESVRDFAASTVLQYAIAPGEVFVGLTQSLTLTVTNPTQNPVTLNAATNDEIDVTFPVSPPASEADALVDAVTFSASAPTGWIVGAGLQSNVWAITPTGQQTLGPGASFSVRFDNVAVNATLGTPAMQIAEYIGSASGTYSVTVTKIAQSLNVIAWPVPYNVGLGQGSAINWTSFGGTSVTVNNLPSGTGSQTFKVQGSPPYPGRYTVVLKPTDSERTFGVVVNTSDGRHAQTVVPVSQMSPLITQFDTVGTPPNPIPAGQTAQIEWTILFAANAYLAKPDGTNRAVQPIQQHPLTVSPVADVLAGAFGNYANLPTSAIYTLQANGYGPSMVQTVEFPIAGAGLLYLKFASPPGTGTPSVMASLDNVAWTAFQQTGGGGSYNDVTVLTIFQPGGTSIAYYLGLGDTTHPQIQYFDAAKSNGAVTLSWVTANLVSLVLNPGAIQITGDQIAKGSTKVTPTATTTYVLTATSASGATVPSTLTVTVA